MYQPLEAPVAPAEKTVPFSSFTFLSMRESDRDIPALEKETFIFLIFDFEFCLPLDISFSDSMLANILVSVNSADYTPLQFTCTKVPNGHSHQHKFCGALWYKVPRTWDDVHVTVPMRRHTHLKK